MSETKPFNAAEYQNFVANQTSEIVDVVPPSGYTFKFRKPSKTHLLFEIGTLPQASITRALESWKKTAETGEFDDATAEDQQRLFNQILATRDKVLELSHSPKIVIGKAQNENEISVDFISSDDLDYFVKWVQAGGESVMLDNFSSRRKTSFASSARRSK